MSVDDLTLEKLKISERLGSVENEIKALVELKKVEHSYMQEISQQQQILLTKIAQTVYGNGTEGLTTRVSKHDQTLKVLTGMMWAIASVTISLGIKAVFDRVVLGVG